MRPTFIMKDGSKLEPSEEEKIEKEILSKINVNDSIILRNKR